MSVFEDFLICALAVAALACAIATLALVVVGITGGAC